MMDPILKLDRVHTHIGRYHVLQGASFNVAPNQITVLLGRNGAGKTTTLRTIMGLWKASSGTIHMAGDPIHTLKTEEIAIRGIGYVPENMGIFTGLTVHQNLLLGTRKGKFDQERLAWLLDLFPPLKKFWNLPAGNLSGGQKQMLSIGRAVVEPKALLLIDEPTKGIAPAILDEMITAFRSLKASNTTILLVEQNFGFACEIGDHIAVMDDGKIVHTGSMPAFVADAESQQRYLGLSLEDAAQGH